MLPVQIAHSVLRIRGLFFLGMTTHNLKCRVACFLIQSGNQSYSNTVGYLKLCLTLLGPAHAAKRQPSGAPATRSVAARRGAAQQPRRAPPIFFEMGHNVRQLKLKIKLLKTVLMALREGIENQRQSIHQI